MLQFILFVVSAAVIDLGNHLAQLARATAAFIALGGPGSRQPWASTTPAIPAPPVRHTIDAPSPSQAVLEVLHAPQPSGRVAASAAAVESFAPTSTPTPVGELQLYVAASSPSQSLDGAETFLLFLLLAVLVVTPLLAHSGYRIRGRPLAQWLSFATCALFLASPVFNHLDSAASAIPHLSAAVGTVSSYFQGTQAGLTAPFGVLVGSCAILVLSQAAVVYIRGYALLQAQFDGIKERELAAHTELARLRDFPDALVMIQSLRTDVQSSRDATAKVQKEVAVLAWDKRKLGHRSQEQSRVVRKQAAEIEEMETEHAAVTLRFERKEVALRAAGVAKDSQARTLETLRLSQAQELEMLKATIASMSAQFAVAQAQRQQDLDTDTKRRKDLEVAKEENARLLCTLTKTQADVKEQTDVSEAVIADLRSQLRQEAEAAKKLKETAACVEERVAEAVQRAIDLEETNIGLRQSSTDAQASADHRAEIVEQKDAALHALASQLKDAQIQLEASSAQGDALVAAQGQVASLALELKATQEDLDPSHATVRKLRAAAWEDARKAEVSRRRTQHFQREARRYAQHAKAFVIELAKSRGELEELEAAKESWLQDLAQAMQFLEEKTREAALLAEETEGWEIRHSQALLLVACLKDQVEGLEEKLKDERCSIVGSASTDSEELFGSGVLSRDESLLASSGSLSELATSMSHLLDASIPSPSSLASIDGFEPFEGVKSIVCTLAPPITIIHESTLDRRIEDGIHMFPTPLASIEEADEETSLATDTEETRTADFLQPSSSLDSNVHAFCGPPQYANNIVSFDIIESMAKEFVELELALERQKLEAATTIEIIAKLETPEKPAVKAKAGDMMAELPTWSEFAAMMAAEDGVDTSASETCAQSQIKNKLRKGIGKKKGVF